MIRILHSEGDSLHKSKAFIRYKNKFHFLALPEVWLLYRPTHGFDIMLLWWRCCQCGARAVASLHASLVSAHAQGPHMVWALVCKQRVSLQSDMQVGLFAQEERELLQC